MVVSIILNPDEEEEGLGGDTEGPSIIEINPEEDEEEDNEGSEDLTLDIKTSFIDSSKISIFAQYNLFGNISIKYKFNSPSDATITLAIAESEYNLLLQNIKKIDQSNPIVLFGRRYVITDYRTTKGNPNQWQFKAIAIELSLSSIWSSYGNPSRCALDFPNDKKYQEKYGFNTVREELEETALINGGFVYYGTDAFPEIREFGNTTKHELLNRDILNSEFVFSAPGVGAMVDGVYLTQEYRNTKLTLGQGTSTDKQKDETITRIEAENCFGVADAQSPAPYAPGGGLTILDKQELANPDNCFDTGGRTKKIRQITEKNGATIKVIETIYGFVFTSMETYAIVDVSNGSGPQLFKEEFKGDGLGLLSPSAFWKVVEETTTNYKYDENGWLISVIRTGTRRAREKQESSGIEQVKTWLKYLATTNKPILSPTSSGPIDPKWYQQSRQTAITVNRLYREFLSYKFSITQPILDITVYELKDLGSYYNDIKLQNQQSKNDPKYVPPKYLARSRRRYNNNQTAPNPANNPEDPYSPFPKVFTRQEYTEIEENQILIPNFSKTLLTPEKFKKINYNFSAQGEGGKNKLEVATATENAGRPSPHQRLELNVDSGSTASFLIPGLVTNTLNSQILVPYTPPFETVTTGGGINLTTNTLLEPENSEISILINSEGSIPDNANNAILSKQEEDSLSFNTKSIAKGLLGAKTKLAITNTQEANTTDLDLVYQDLWAEGDLITWQDKTWLLKEIAIDLIIENQTLRCTSYKVQIGQYLNPNISYTTINPDQNTNNDNSITINP